MNKKSVILGVIVALVMVLVTILVIIPKFLSTDFGRKITLSYADDLLSGKLEIENWSLRWFGGIHIEGVRYDDSSAGLRVDIQEVKGKQGLFSLLTNPDNIGQMVLNQPDIYLYPISLKEKKSTLAQQQKQEAPEAAASDKVPLILGYFNINNGSIRFVSGDGKENILAKDINMVVSAADLKAPIVYQINMKSKDGQGHIVGEGSFVPADDATLSLEDMQSKAHLNIKSWEVNDILSIAGILARVPQGKGRLNADVNLDGSISSGVRIVGNAAIPELKLWGGPLQSDKPVVKNIDFKLDTIKQNSLFKINQFDLQSSLFNISADGVIQNEKQNRLNGRASADLPEIFSQMPETVKLREGTKLSSGLLKLAVQLKSAEGKTAFNGSGLITQLKGISNGKKLSWKKPVAVDAIGEIHPDGFWLEKFSVQSEFFKGQGQGDLSNLSLNISADLKKALAELRKFIEIKEWDGRGKLNANFRLTPVDDQASNATSKITIDNFELLRNKKQVIGRQSISADLSASINLQGNQNQREFTGFSFDFTSNIGRGKLNADRLSILPSQGLPIANNVLFNGKFDLRQVTLLLQNFDILPNDVLLTGQSTINTKGDIKDNSILLSSSDTQISKFNLKLDKKTIQENQLSLKTKGNISPSARSMHLAPLDIVSDSGKIHIPELIISDWSNIQNAIKTRAKARLNIANTFKAYKDFMALPDRSQIAGNGDIDLDLDFTNAKTQSLKIDGNITPLKYTSENLPPITEDRVTFNLDLKSLRGSGLYNIQNLDLNSRILSLKAGGSYKQEKNRDILELEGSMTPDLKRLSKFLKPEDGHQVELEGKSERPFKLKLVSRADHDDDLLKNMNFDGTLFVKSMKSFGLEILPADIPIRVKDSKAMVELSASANGGQLVMRPVVDMRKVPYVVTFSENTDVMSQVQITESMAQTLLSSLHPSFAGSIDPGGMINLFMQHFRWPLDNTYTEDIAFAGNLNIDELSMMAGPMLSSLLSMIGINENKVHLENQEIKFEAENGRVKTSPVRFRADEYFLELQGSMGFDKTIDFIARLPVTRKMVGGKAYEYLKGVTIDVPIGGTVSKPKIDEAAMENAAGSLVQQTMQKTIEKKATDLLQQLFNKKK